MGEEKIVLESQGQLLEVPNNVCKSSRDGDTQGDCKESPKVAEKDPERFPIRVGEKPTGLNATDKDYKDLKR